MRSGVSKLDALDRYEDLPPGHEVDGEPESRQHPVDVAGRRPDRQLLAETIPFSVSADRKPRGPG